MIPLPMTELEASCTPARAGNYAGIIRSPAGVIGALAHEIRVFKFAGFCRL